MQQSNSEPTTQFDDKNLSMGDTSVCRKRVQRTNWKVVFEKVKIHIGKSLQASEGEGGLSTA